MDRFFVGQGVVLPLEAITRRIAVLAPRNGAKTHAATVLVEEMVADGLPVVVLDPLGTWYGLSLATDGTAKGLPVRILGGSRGGLGIREHSGPLVAECAIDWRRPLVVDLSSLPPAGARRFVSEFALEVSVRRPRMMHIVVEAADDLLGSDAKVGNPLFELYSSAEKRFGFTLVSESPSRLGASVLERVELLLAARTVSPSDRGVVRSWVRSRTSASATARVLASLSSLDSDEAWLCSPTWLRVLERFRLRHRATYDGFGALSNGLRPPQSRAAAAELQRLQARASGAPSPSDGVAAAPELSAEGPPSDSEGAGTRKERRRRGRPVEALVLRPGERVALQRYAAQHGCSARLALRAQIVLACAEGLLNGQVARQLGLCIYTVGKWRRRFVQQRLRGLELPVPSIVTNAERPSDVEAE